MRTFAAVEASTPRTDAPQRFYGITPLTPIGFYAPFPQRRITQPRYEAEKIAIAAGEPIRPFCADEEFFAMAAAERAQIQAHQLLDEMAGE